MILSHVIEKELFMNMLHNLVNKYKYTGCLKHLIHVSLKKKTLLNKYGTQCMMN